jgi:AraC-like DNA-binding protein
MSDLTVAAGLAHALLAFAVAKGADRAALIERSGIDPGDLTNQDNRIPFERYVALMRASKALSGDAALALNFGEAVDLSQFSVVGLIGRAAQTMMEAFLQLNRYGGLVVEVDLKLETRFRLAPGDGGLWLIDTRPNPNDFPELTESTLARIVCGCARMIVDSGWSGEMPAVREVHVSHRDPGYATVYERVLRAPVTFESDKNAILVDAMAATIRFAREPRYIFGVLSEHADALLETLRRTKTMRGRVESLLVPVLHTGDIGIDAVAGKMGVSRWTLARRLKDEGTTFEKVLDALRHTMALNYLSGQRVSANETAYLVGFSDPAAFSRAFKRWTGTSPRAAKAKPIGSIRNRQRRS